MMKKSVIVTIILIFATLFAIPVRAEECQNTPPTAKNVYIYDWESVVTEVDQKNSTIRVRSDWESVFCIDTTIQIYSEQLTWYSLGGRRFFVQSIPSGPQEAVFIGEIDGFPQVLKIPFYGTVVQINSRGIVYEREGMIYYKSFYPTGQTGNWNFQERKGWPVEAPRELYSHSDLIAVTTVAPF